MRLDISEFMQSAVRVLLVLFCLFCGFLGFLYWLDYQHGKNSAKREPMLAEIDWKENGIDPAAQNVRPEVVVLAGTFEFGNRSGFFEIKMRGRDLYFRREWTGGPWWTWTTETVVTNDYEIFSLRRKGTGVGGGGGSSQEDGETAFVLARRIWSTNGFVGASENQLRSDDKAHAWFEEFSELKQYGPYKIPNVMRFKNHSGEKTYQVKKVLFTNQPGPDWFASKPWRPR